MSYGTLVRVTDALAAEGLTPKGLPGGGVGGAHYEAEHLKNLLLGCSASVPAEAPAAVAALDKLESVPTTVIADEGKHWDAFKAGVRLGDYLVYALNELANPNEEMNKQIEEAKLYPFKSIWKAEFAPSVPLAHVDMVIKGYITGVNFCAVESFSDRVLWSVRTLRITLPVLAVAGELLADTLQRRGTLIPGPSTSGKRKGNALGNEKAATGTNRRGSSKMQPADEPHSRTPHKAQANDVRGVVQDRTESSHVSVSGPQVVRGSSPTSNNLERQYGRGMDPGGPRGSRDQAAHGGRAA